MKRKIYPILFIFLAIFITDVFAENNLVYSLTLRKWNDGTINKEGIRLVEGSAPDRIGQNDIPKSYTLKVISYNNDVLYSFKFEIELTRFYAPPKEWFDETGNQIYFPKEQTLTTEEDQIFVLTAPYFRNAKSIEIYDPNNQLVLTIDVSEYSLPEKESNIIWTILIILITAVLGFFGYKNKGKITGILKSKAKSKPSKRLETKTVNVKKSPSKTWKIVKIVLIIVLILIIIIAFNVIHTYLDMRSVVLSSQEASRLAINP